MARLSQGQGDLGADRRCRNIPDPAIRAVTPGPAAAVVEHPELVALVQPGDRLGVIGRFGQQGRRRQQVANQRFGIVGGNHPAGQSRVGEVLAVGVGGGVGKRGNPGQGEAVNGR
jgi:hypothetical protein